MMDSCRRLLAAALLVCATLAGAQSVAPLPPEEGGARNRMAAFHTRSIRLQYPEISSISGA